MSANPNFKTFDKVMSSFVLSLRIPAILASLMVALAAPTFAQERLPWEPRGQSPDYSGDYRSNNNTTTSADYYNGPGAIRQPRPDPYYAPPRRQSASRPYDSGAPARSYDRRGANGTYGRDNGYRRDGGSSQLRQLDRNYDGSARSRAPYAERPAELPSYYQPYDDGRSSRRANYSAGNQPGYNERAPDGSYSMSEIRAAGHGFFGSISKGLASVIEYAFKRSGRPNGYILGEGAGGAFIAGLRYGEGTLFTKSAGRHRVYWQGPTIGYDAGAEGSKTMVLVYNLRRPSDLYKRYGGVDGSAYLVGGVGISFLKRGRVVLAPIRAGVGLRLGANIGYLKYTRRPTWNPF